MEHCVLVDRLGCVALAIAAHVRRHRVEARRGERFDLMTPGIPGFGKAVAHQRRWPFALFGDVEADAVALDDSVRWCAHVALSLRCLRTPSNQKTFKAGRSTSGNTTAIQKRCLYGLDF